METNPDLTFCFKNSVLIWVPCGFLALFALLDVHIRSKSRYGDIPWSFLNVSKSLILALLIALTFTDLYMMLVEDEVDIYPVQIWSVSIKAGTFVSSPINQFTDDPR